MEVVEKLLFRSKIVHYGLFIEKTLVFKSGLMKIQIGRTFGPMLEKEEDDRLKGLRKILPHFFVQFAGETDTM